MAMNEKFWLWGYTLDHGGERVPFAPASPVYCSLENAAEYFGFPNAVFMNSMHGWDDVERHLSYLQASQKVICALPHGEPAVLDGAEKISELSRQFPNIKGVILDDFLQLSGHRTSPELVAEIRERLHRHNPDLELYVVMYSDGNHEDITPYLELIDGIVLWRWVSTEEFWRVDFGPLLHRWKVTTGKKLFHGIYLQNYGEGGDETLPVDFKLWKLMWMRIFDMLQHSQFLDGCVLLQNAWVGNPRFAEHCLWLKQMLEWFYATNVNR